MVVAPCNFSSFVSVIGIAGKPSHRRYHPRAFLMALPCSVLQLAIIEILYSAADKVTCMEIVRVIHAGLENVEAK